MTMIRSVVALAVAIGLLAMPLAAKAQPTGKVYRIGILTPFSLSASRRDTPTQAFFDELRQLGWIEGQNFVLEWPDSEGTVERMPQLAAELVRRQVDLIVASTTTAARAAQAATKTIPIVFGLVPDPVGQGLVESLARPGRNITGLSHPALERHPKLLQLLAEAVPRARKAAYLWNPANPPGPKVLDAMRVAARSLGVQLLSFEVKTAEDIETAFASARRQGADGVVVYQDALTHAHLTKIAALALKHRLPLAAGDRRWAEAGALISFAPDWWAELRRTAHYVDRILKGANPATLPVEEPMRFEIVVNLKTAKTLGVTIPQSVLVRSDKVID